MSGDTKLGPKQRGALLVLGRARRRGEAHPTPYEVAETLAQLRGFDSRTRRPTSDGEAMANTLRSLERKGLAMRTGSAFNGARCWTLTALGCQVEEAL